MAQGRGFESGDRAGGEPVVVVNETFVRRHLSDGPALGRRVDFLWGTTGAQTIVGVVSDIREGDLNEPSRPAIYIPMTQRPIDGAYLIVTASGDASSQLSAVRREILALDANLPLANVRTMDQVIADRHSRQRFATALLGVFSLLALLLAAIGVYGVISYGVAQRTAEIGVRTALGAQNGDIVRLVLRQGMALVAAGVVLGIGGALLATRALRAELFGVQPTDAATFVFAALVLVITAFAASAIPSWRATRVDPLTALRHD
jgi:predicted permease